MYEERSHWDETLTEQWIASLRRILLRIQTFRHGGALLLTPDSSLRHLNVKYPLKYYRLSSALHKNGLAIIRHCHASDRAINEYVEKGMGVMPVELYLDESVFRNDADESRSEIEGCIWFISLLTRVDGLVLMNHGLSVNGFGVEVTATREPCGVYVAEDLSGTTSKLRKVDYNHFGTRHRSLMRYCASVPNSVAFVISQDGAVRVLTKVREKIVMWENIKLQSPSYVYRKLRKR